MSIDGADFRRLMHRSTAVQHDLETLAAARKVPNRDSTAGTNVAGGSVPPPARPAEKADSAAQGEGSGSDGVDSAAKPAPKRSWRTGWFGGA